jgi:DNA-binding response OmpR family regulator
MVQLPSVSGRGTEGSKEKVLSENGVVVDSYENPTLALENFNTHSYNLIILDIRMPELNGIALCRGLINWINVTPNP